MKFIFGDLYPLCVFFLISTLVFPTSTPEHALSIFSWLMQAHYFFPDCLVAKTKTISSRALLTPPDAPGHRLVILCFLIDGGARYEGRKLVGKGIFRVSRSFIEYSLFSLSAFGLSAAVHNLFCLM